MVGVSGLMRPVSDTETNPVKTRPAPERAAPATSAGDPAVVAMRLGIAVCRSFSGAKDGGAAIAGIVPAPEARAPNHLSTAPTKCRSRNRRSS
jgi:hypothetical protein